MRERRAQQRASHRQGDRHPVLIGDPPLFNFLGAHQLYAPGSVVGTETSDGVVGIGETYGRRDHCDAVEAVRRKHPDRAEPPLPQR
ncbi:hypothetical protein [Streptomyces sp. NPDC001536]|uniref:hypothetical protein n=1 Tax=Streptomyces sp. NPDC001536 TaxID=3364583 RepID=UPI00368C3495